MADVINKYLTFPSTVFNDKRGWASFAGSVYNMWSVIYVIASQYIPVVGNRNRKIPSLGLSARWSWTSLS